MAKAELTQCLKFKRLMRELPECPRPLLIGHLDLMWQTAWAGKVVAFRSADDAEVAAEWAGETGRLAAALLELRWLVHSELGLEINDWWEHAPDYVKRRRDIVALALERGYQIAPIRDALPKSLRFWILKRDRFKCGYCGTPAPEARLEVDHVLPVAAGGSDEPENLVTACSDCNAGKGAAFLDNES